MYKIIGKLKNLLLITVIVILASCNNWLDVEPENDLIRQEFWQTKDDVDAVLAATYDAFRGTFLESLIWGEIRGDLITIMHTDFGNYMKIAKGEIFVSNDKISWKNYYYSINLANTLIEYSNEVLDLDDNFSNELKLSYEAEAIFIRSMCYFYLVRIWKDVPFTRSAFLSDTIEFNIPQMDADILLNELIEDLKYAETIAYTEHYLSIPSKFRGRANKNSIRALIADIYLWLEQYDDCLEYCDKVLESPRYSLLLENDWFDLFYPGNSNESIFEIQFNDAYDKEENPMYDKFLKTTGAGVGFLKSDLFETADVRRCGLNPTAKYFYTNTTTRNKRTNSQRDANFIYYRLAEIYLMKSECYAELGKFKEAYQYLNEIRTRAGIGTLDMNTSINQYRSNLLEERAREFAMEGKRWFDILRHTKKNDYADKRLMTEVIMNRADDPNTAERLRAMVRDPNYYYLPKPENDVKINSGLYQNPIYE